VKSQRQCQQPKVCKNRKNVCATASFPTTAPARRPRPSVCSQARDDKFLRQYIGLFAAHLLISQHTAESEIWQNSSWTGGTWFSLIALSEEIQHTIVIVGSD
jgi:hypothetical protein